MSRDLKVYLSTRPDIRDGNYTYLDTFQVRVTVEGEYETLYSILNHAQYIYDEDYTHNDMVWKSYVMNRDLFECDAICNSTLKESILSNQIYKDNKDFEYLVFQPF